MKDKKWLIKKLDEAAGADAEASTWNAGFDAGINEAIALAEELDEPDAAESINAVYDKLKEIAPLSEKSFDYYWNCINDGVELDDFHKPTIPKFVAEWIEAIQSFKWDRITILNQIFHETSVNYDSVACWWCRNNFLEFVIAWDTNCYEIEQEKRYHVLLPAENSFQTRIALVKNGDHYYFEEITHPYSEIAILTEAEIKSINEHYLPFAEEVTK